MFPDSLQRLQMHAARLKAPACASDENKTKVVTQAPNPAWIHSGAARGVTLAVRVIAVQHRKK